MNQIGISEKELNDDLQSTENNMSKIFITMLTNRYCDLEGLPWECAKSGVSKPLDYDSSFTQSSNIFMGNDDNPWIKNKVSEPQYASQSLELYSYAARASWAIGDVLTVNEVYADKVIETYGITVWNIFGNVQLVIGELPYQYFHPDPLTMYIRSQDASFYMTVQADYTTMNDVKIKFLLHKGESLQFDELTQKMIQAISK